MESNELATRLHPDRNISPGKPRRARCTHTPTPSGILFVRDESIWQAAVDGSNQKEITKVGLYDSYFWIPGIHRLIVGGDDDFTAVIKIVDLNSARIDTVHCEALSGANDMDETMHYFTISVSTDGDKIAYGLDFAPGDETVVYNIPTKSSHHIKCSGGVLSPNGESLAWVRDNNVYITSLKDSSEEQLTRFGSAKAVYDTNPSAYYNLETIHGLIGWSGDGLCVLYYFGNNGQGSTVDEATSHICAVDIRTHAT